ncbi:unnamed protein product, partial [Meganyctiphanes norvegica]
MVIMNPTGQLSMGSPPDPKGQPSAADGILHIKCRKTADLIFNPLPLFGCHPPSGYTPVTPRLTERCFEIRCSQCPITTKLRQHVNQRWPARTLVYGNATCRRMNINFLYDIWTWHQCDIPIKQVPCFFSRGYLTGPLGQYINTPDNESDNRGVNYINVKLIIEKCAKGIFENKCRLPGPKLDPLGPLLLVTGDCARASGNGFPFPRTAEPCTSPTCYIFSRQNESNIPLTPFSPRTHTGRMARGARPPLPKAQFAADCRPTRNYLSDMSSPSEDDLFDIHHHGLDSSSRPHLHSHHPYSYVNSVEVSKAKIWRVRPRAKGSEALTLMTLTWTGRPPCSPGPAAAVQLQPAPMATPLHHQQRSTSPAADVNECTCNCLCSLGPTPESAALAKHQVTSSSSRSSSSSAMTVISPISGTSETVMDIPDNVPDAHTGASIVLVVLWITYCHLFGSPTLS